MKGVKGESGGRARWRWVAAIGAFLSLFLAMAVTAGLIHPGIPLFGDVGITSCPCKVFFSLFTFSASNSSRSLFRVRVLTKYNFICLSEFSEVFLLRLFLLQFFCVESMEHLI